MERKENEHQLKKLKALSSSEFEIKDGQPDIIRWTVVNSTEQMIGMVSDLLFDQEEQKVRYLVLDLNGNCWGLEERQVLIPIGVAELDKNHDHVVLPNITAQQITVLPDYHKDMPIISTNSELYGHKDFDESKLHARRQQGSYEDHIPFQVITKVFQEEDEADQMFKTLLNSGIPETALKITAYNPLNSVTDLQGRTNTEFIGDGSRDEYILSIAASTAAQAVLVDLLINQPRA